MTEAQLQKKTIKEYRKEGWLVIRLRSIDPSGFPDILCIRSGVVKFIEFKGPKAKTSSLQDFRIDELKNQGMTVEVVRPPKDKSLEE